jgi:predicted tellurium resistance membrane protein TerC
MLTDKDKAFIVHWEQVRLREASFMRKLLSGLPMALIFALPVLLLVIVVKMFLPEFETRISKVPASTYVMVVLAVLLITLFYAFFRMHHRWEENEELYKLLKLKQKQAD